MPASKQLDKIKALLIEAESQSDRNKILDSIECPIIEDGESQGKKLVTFVYRLDNAQLNKGTRIYLHSNIFGHPLTEESQLGPIHQTDILYLSLLLPSDLRFTYNFINIDNSVDMTIHDSSDMNTSSSNYELTGEFKKSYTLLSSLFAQNRVEIDSNNPHKIIHYMDYDHPDKYYGMESLVELPLAPSQPYIPPSFEMIKIERDKLKQEGRLLEYSVRLNETCLKEADNYKGDTIARKYWVYLPREYVKESNDQYPMALFLDGSEYLNQIPAPYILDKMIADKTIPPLIAVFLDYSADYRGKEYDCNPHFTKFIANDFMAILRNRHNLPISTDPKVTTIIGSSLSGLAAFYAGLTYPSVFGNVISQSPSFETKKLNDFKKMIASHHEQCRDSLFIAEIGSYETLPIDLRFKDGTVQSLSSLNANKTIVEYMSNHHISMTLHQYTGAHSVICWRGSLSDRLKETHDYRLKGRMDNKPK